MFDSISNSSYRLSNLSILSSNSLNPLASMNPAILTRIKKEAQNYEGAAHKCQLIWQALKKNDIAGFRLSEKVIEVIFQQYQTDIYHFTKIHSLKQFMNIFDADRDGFLNQDQQIKIFSYIKQRMELVANNSLKIQAYSHFKALMKQVRSIEAKISKWEQHLRKKIHDQELDQYKLLGQKKIDQFCLVFDKEFQNLSNIKIHRRQIFQKQAMMQMQRLEQKLSKATEYIKIKPKKKIKQLQVQQKLVALQQRVEQALDFRRQLSELQIEQKLRIDKLMLQNANQQRQNLMKKHEKGRKQLELKLQQLEFKLIIRMKKQFDILQKQNKLHQNQLQRMQSFQVKWAIKKGTFEPQMKRLKKLQSKRNQILSDYKKVQKNLKDIKIQEDQNTNTTIIENSQNGFYNRKKSSKCSQGNKILESTTNFKIVKKYQCQVPVNKTYSGSSKKLQSFNKQKHNEKMYSLCCLYGQNLQNKNISQVVNKNIEKQQNERRRNFILSKIL